MDNDNVIEIVETVENLPTNTWKTRAIKAAVIATGVVAGIGLVAWIGKNDETTTDEVTQND